MNWSVSIVNNAGGKKTILLIKYVEFFKIFLIKLTTTPGMMTAKIRYDANVSRYLNFKQNSYGLIYSWTKLKINFFFH